MTNYDVTNEEAIHIPNCMKYDQRITYKFNPQKTKEYNLPTYTIKSSDYNCGFYVSRNLEFDIFAEDDSIQRLLCMTFFHIVESIPIEIRKKSCFIKTVHDVLSNFIDIMDRGIDGAEEAIYALSLPTEICTQCS